MENAVPSGRYGQFATFATSNFSLARDKGIMSSEPKTVLGKVTSKAQKLIMQQDGNLVVYDHQGGAFIWDARTNQKGTDARTKGAKMVVENDGTISVYNAANQKIWNNKNPVAPLPAPVAPPAVAGNEVYNKIMALKSRYPHGMKWSDDNIVNGNSGCYAFSMIAMEAAFGKDRKERKHNNFNDIKIGDMLRLNNDVHSVIVIGKDNKQFTFAEGNWDKKIHWGRTMPLAEVRSTLTYVLTSYP